ncbi:hypothetical protein BGZ94_010018 [Podila epigama]|nr:hypothetical protein BGZ94_010018 [Podila epigama]
MTLSPLPRLPIEVIIHISTFIDKPTVVAFLQVCKEWHQLFGHLRWRDVSRTQWHHAEFPLCQAHLMSDDELSSIVSQVRTLEWYSNKSLTGGGLDRARWRQRHDDSSHEAQYLLTRQLPPEQLARMLKMMKDTLLELSISQRLDGSLDNVYAAMTNLRALVSLTFEHRCCWLAPQVQQDWLPLMSRLERLDMRKIPPGLLSSLTKDALEQSTPWSMRVLKVSDNWGLLAEYCPFLKELHWEQYRTMSPCTTPLGSWCPNLEVLYVSGRLEHQAQSNPARVISTLGKLKSLTHHAHSMVDIDFLMTPSPRGNATDGSKDSEMACPLMEQWQILADFARVPRYELSAVISNVLQTRPRMKELTMPLLDLHPKEMITGPTLGQLRHLSAYFYPLKLRTMEEWKAWSPDERAATWRFVFNQLAKSRQLETLSLRVMDVDREAALEELARAGGWPELERLTLMDHMAAAWTKDELGRWLALMPKLKYIYLKPLKRDNLEQVREWIMELGNGRITFGWGNWRVLVSRDGYR